jgi:ketosteroid isomerase-like protein
MNAMILLAGSITLLPGADVPADATAVREAEQSLRTLNAAVARCDAAAMRRLFADHHVSITPYYGMMNREIQLKNVAGWKITEYMESDWKVTLLGKDTACVTYQFTVKGMYKGEKLPAKSRVVSIWVRRNGSWLEASYQETPVEGEPAQDDAATKEVARLANTMCQAFATGDADTVKRLRADDQVAIFGRGRPETKTK